MSEGEDGTLAWTAIFVVAVLFCALAGAALYKMTLPHPLNAECNRVAAKIPHHDWQTSGNNRVAVSKDGKTILMCRVEVEAKMG